MEDFFKPIKTNTLVPSEQNIIIQKTSEKEGKQRPKTLQEWVSLVKK